MIIVCFQQLSPLNHEQISLREDMFCLIIWVMKIVVFTPRDEHSQGEHPHNSLQ